MSKGGVDLRVEKGFGVISMSDIPHSAMVLGLVCGDGDLPQDSESYLLVR